MPFEFRKFRSIEVCVKTDDPDHPINLTSLAASLNDNKRETFKHILQGNEGFWWMVESFRTNDAENEGIDDKPVISHPKTLAWLIEQGICIRVQGGDNQHTFGTYGPEYLADWILINCKPVFFKQVHALFKVTDQLAAANNVDFITQLNTIIEEKDKELNKVKAENDDLWNDIDQLETDVNNLYTENTTLSNENISLKEQLDRIIAQNNELLQMGDDQLNAAKTASVEHRSLGRRVDRIADAVIAVHEEIAGIRVKDKKMNRTNDIFVIYTISDKPSEELKKNTPSGHTWLITFNGQPTSFNNLPKDKTVLYRSESNRLDSYRELLQIANVTRHIVRRTPTRYWLVNDNDRQALFHDIDAALNRDNTYESVNRLEQACFGPEPVNQEEINLKLRIMAEAQPLHYITGRYRRRVYCRERENGPLVLVENADDPASCKWFYRYGRGGTEIAELDYALISVGSFTKEYDSRITYE